jgi:hypothetical protein
MDDSAQTMAVMPPPANDLAPVAPVLDITDPASFPAMPGDLPAEPPFAIRRVALDATLKLKPVFTFEPRDCVLDPAAPSRTVFRTVGGRVLLTEVSGTEAVQIGPSVSRAEAGELARAVLDSARTGYAPPHALFSLSLALLDALQSLDAAERLLAKSLGDNVTVLPRAGTFGGA